LKRYMIEGKNICPSEFALLIDMQSAIIRRICNIKTSTQKMSENSVAPVELHFEKKDCLSPSNTLQYTLPNKKGTLPLGARSCDAGYGMDKALKILEKRFGYLSTQTNPQGVGYSFLQNIFGPVFIAFRMEEFYKYYLHDSYNYTQFHLTY
ncbi:hypothetical protein ACJX0J_040236, partial [Zea mays]